MKNVGPGQYNLPDIKEKQPSWTMSQKIDYMAKNFDIAGTQYTIPSKMVESKGKSFGLKLVEKPSITGPGPGKYATDKLKQKNY